MVKKFYQQKAVKEQQLADWDWSFPNWDDEDYGFDKHPAAPHFSFCLHASTLTNIYFAPPGKQ